MINRKNFDNEWLFIERKNEKGNWINIKLSEKINQRKKVTEILKELLIDYYTNFDQKNYYLNNDEKFCKLEQFISNRIPNNNDVRLGDFGEIIGTEHLIQRYDYYFPAYRLRLKTNPHTSQTGEDFIGFEIKDNDVVCIVVGEAKVRKEHNIHAIKDAYDSLIKSYSPHPVSLSYISTKVFNDGNHELSENIEDLMNGKKLYQISYNNVIFYISGTNPKKPVEFDVQNRELKNLTIIHLFLNGVNTLVNTAYEECKDFYYEEK